MLPKRIVVLSVMALVLSLLGAASVEAKKPPQADHTPPDAVTNLAPDSTATTHQSITLTWTATGDDGLEGQASTYEIRYAFDGPMTEEKWDTDPLNRASALTDPYGVPHPDKVVYPAASGEDESVEFAGLAADTTYYFGIKACDEAGNCSPVAAADDETTHDAGPGEWAVDNVNENVWTAEGHRKDVDVLDTGQVGLWYADGGNFYHSSRATDGSWSHDLFGGGVDDGCLAFAYSPSGVPWASTCVNGVFEAVHPDPDDPDQLIYETVDEVTGAVELSFVPSTGEPALAYRNDGSVYYAWRDTGTWHVDVIEGGTAPKKNPRLAFDPTQGHPVVAYVAIEDGDYEVRLAEKIGGTWTINPVHRATAPWNNVATVALAYHPTEHYPAIAHMGAFNEGLLYTYRTASGWTPSEYIDTADKSVTGGYEYTYGMVQLAFGADGTAYTAYKGAGSYHSFRVFANDGTGWELAFSDGFIPGTPNGLMSDTALTPDGMPIFTYGWDPIRVVERIPPDAGVSMGPTSGLTTTEGGGQATFLVRLDAEPAADVTIPLSSSDTTEGTLTQSSLTFTTANWNVVQEVRVTGENDDDTDGDVAYQVITGDPYSTDTYYDALTANDVDDVTLTNLDDDIPTCHISDLDGGVIDNGVRWQATVSIAVHDEDEAPVSGATVSGRWIEGASGSASCTTDASGQCTVTSDEVHKRFGTITFEVTGVSHDSMTYDSVQNHDPDGDSNGTMISVSNPQ